MTAVAAPGRGYQLQVGSPDALAVSVVMFPQQSVLALLRQLASGQPNGGPGWPRATIGRALRPAARFAAQSFTSRAPVIPECCAPIPPLADVAVTEQADRLRDLAPDVLTDELQTWCDSHTLPRQWQAAAEQPRRWLASLADASLDAWAAMQPRWRAAAPLLDREVARVGTAAVRGGMAALLNCLHPRVSYADGVLALPFPRDRCVDLGGRRLALMPMIADRGALAVSYERPEVCYIGYPICPPAPGTQAAANGTLALILGPLRAAALQVLHHPLTVNELAAAVHCAPTTATYHLQQLATASLVTRERHGTSVRVSRTTRGDKLIDLLSDLSGFSTRPMAPVTSTGGTRLRVMGTPASSAAGARSDSCDLPGLYDASDRIRRAGWLAAVAPAQVARCAVGRHLTRRRWMRGSRSGGSRRSPGPLSPLPLSLCLRAPRLRSNDGPLAQPRLRPAPCAFASATGRAYPPFGAAAAAAW